MSSNVKQQGVRVLLVDPSRFTPAYDAGLTEGLREVGAELFWAVRPLRSNEEEEISGPGVLPMFYRRLDRPEFMPVFAWRPAKALAHPAGLIRLLSFVWKFKIQVVHFQWTVIPVVDALAMRILQLCGVTVILTVHDTIPFNGEHKSVLQNLAFDLPIRMADRIIVHTSMARSNLTSRGICENQVVVVPHGPLRFADSNDFSPNVKSDHRWLFTLFGQIKPYKGLETLIRALIVVRDEIRGRVRVVVAGEPHMSLEEIYSLVEDNQLGDIVEIRPKRQSELEMASLFNETDCFLFPYVQIDASGVYYLVKPLQKWLVASRVGVFADDIIDNVTGRLVKVGDVDALANAIVEAVGRIPEKSVANTTTWTNIATSTLDVYSKALRGRSRGCQK